MLVQEDQTEAGRKYTRDVHQFKGPGDGTEPFEQEREAGEY